MEQLIALLQAISPLSAALEAHLRRIIQETKYKKGDIILPLDAICNQIFYIETGLVRSFYYAVEEPGVLAGEEVSNWFMKQGDICIAVLSFLRRIPSYEIHVALEACLCWGITHEQLEEIYVLFPEFNIHGRIITGEYYCQSMERERDLKLKSAEERFALLMEKTPELALRVPNKYLASYMGVKERTLEKLRHDYSIKKNRPPGQKNG